jgi:PAS domain S-box-containing protein
VVQSPPNWQERYEHLVGLSPDLVGLAVDGRLISINRAGLDLLGASSPEQVIGQPLIELVAPAHRNAAAERLRLIAAGAKFLPVEEKWIRLDGAVIDVLVRAAALPDEQQPALQLIARDITQSKNIEDALRESEARHRRLTELYLDLIGVETTRTAELHAALRRAREVGELKSQLLSTVSHELRTPLTTIRGQTTTLLDYADQMTPDEQREALRIVDEQAARLDELIGHILDMSRIEAGTLRVEQVATDLRPILRECVDLAAAQAPGHLFVAHVPDDLPLAQADPRRVRQVMGNLLDNAVKYSMPGTRITVEASDSKGIVKISVQDEGPGIAPEHLPHLFDRFYRVESGPVRAAGVGLGLPISKGLVEAMGGQVSIASQVGQGSTFTFILPTITGVSQHAQDR